MSNANSQPGTPIKDAVALVTGGHRGFGRAMVEELLERGADKIYATSRSPQPRLRASVSSSHMVKSVANILGVSESRISVKATTTEGLGFTGRQEGIAAQAVATVRI